MLLSLSLALAASSVVAAVPPGHLPHLPHGQRPHYSKRSTTSSSKTATSTAIPVPINPITVESATFLCNVTSDLPVARDLGFIGQIDNTMIFTYGDTLDTTGPFYLTSDSSSIGTKDPCYVLNTQRTPDGQHQTNMVPLNSSWNNENPTDDAMGGTNVVPTGDGAGMMFFLKNHRPGGTNSTIIGAGVARVNLSPQKNVSTTRLAEYWWDSQAGEPNYGDIGAYQDDNYIWGYGHYGMYAYMNRAPLKGWTNLSNWEYWDGSTGVNSDGSVGSWTKNRLYNPKPAQAMQWNSVQGGVWGVDQGQMIWNWHYGKVIWVYALDYADGDGTWGIRAKVADRPRGPWSEVVELFKVKQLTNTTLVYCPVANPYFDQSGKTLIVTVDNGSGVVQATKVVFGPLAAANTTSKSTS